MSAIRRVPDRSFDQGDLVRSFDHLPQYRHQPWFLAGAPSGEIRITNGWLHPSCVRLYRFADRRQALAAAPIVMREARLGINAESWHVAAVADHRPLWDNTGALAKLEAWARRLEPQLEHRLRRLGAGHYSMIARRRELGLVA